MADPKYVNLRGIVYDQPDCYETSDLPEADQAREEPEEESEFIEKVHIDVTSSFSKFKGKSLLTDGVDFSDRLSRGRTTGYYARSGDWELAAEGEKETPLQRYERLKLEFKELTEDLSSIEEKGEKKEPETMMTEVSRMLNQLESLRLEQLPESETVDLTDPQGIYMRKLLNELERESKSKGVEVSTGAGGTPGEGRVMYSVLARPDHAQAQVSARIARLEQQVHDIQSALTPSNSNTGKLLGERSLLEVARELESQVSLLVPSQLEAADSRISALLSKMDKVQEKAPSQAADTEANKVEELYELLKGSGEVSDILLPRVIERLTTVESLHRQALDFSKSKSEYETLQAALKNDFQTTKKLLNKMDENLNSNMQMLKTTVEKLDGKVRALSTSKPAGK